MLDLTLMARFEDSTHPTARVLRRMTGWKPILLEEAAMLTALIDLGD